MLSRREAERNAEQVRLAGLRVLDRRHFRARGYLDVPESGVQSVSTYVLDLDRQLSLASIVTAMDPDSPDEQPFLSEPVSTWSTRDGLLVPLPSEDAAPLWACVPGEPVIHGPLALLLVLAGAVTAVATPSAASWSTVVDVDRALAHVPDEHRVALQRFADETGLRAGSQVELEVRLDGGAVETVDAELPAEGVRPRVLLHLSIDAGQPPPLPGPPSVGTVADADDVARAWAVDWPDDLPVRPPWRT